MFRDFCLSATWLSTARRLGAASAAVAVLFALPALAFAAEPVLRVGTTGDYAPFSVERDGKFEGLDVDVARRLGDDLGMGIELVRLVWPELSAHLAEVDVVMSGVTMRADRALVGRYSRPYAKSGAVLLVRRSDAGRFGDLAAVDRPGVRVAVNRGGHLERVGRQLLSRATLDAVEDNRSLPSRVRDGRADAALTDSAEAREWLDTDLKMLGPFTSDRKAFLLPADRGDLAARLDDWMAAREADGWLSAERARWLGEGAALDAASATRDSVAALVALRTSLMPSVAAVKRAAGIPIEDPTQEAKVLDRVRAANQPSPQRALAVYRTLIEIAKDVQRKPPAGDAPSATLDALRAAIGRIDEQLGRELRRIPPGDAVSWSAALDRDLSAVGVESRLRLRLAGALATGHLR